jgi:hypothetical protein
MSLDKTTAKLNPIQSSYPMEIGCTDFLSRGKSLKEVMKTS